MESPIIKTKKPQTHKPQQV